MKYIGSKNRIAKDILPIILDGKSDNQYFVDLFAGGMNVTDKVQGLRIANDQNKYVIALFNAITAGWVPPERVSTEEYKEVKSHKNRFPDHVVGWVGFCCSYSGKWFDGYAGITNTKQGVRDYQKEAHSNLMAQKDKLKGVRFYNLDYSEVPIPEKSIVYLDPPYSNTLGYSCGKFDSEKLFSYARRLRQEGHTVFLSEYEAPSDFTCVKEISVKSSLSANGRYGASKLSTEKLFTLL